MTFENAVRLGNFDDFTPPMFEKVIDLFGSDLLVESWRDVDYHVRLVKYTDEITGSQAGITKWHNDGLGFGPQGHLWIVIWSNVLPTEFVLSDCDDIVRPEPGDVVLFNNRQMKHRVPLAAVGSPVRKFWRVTLTNRTVPTPELIEKWRDGLQLLQDN